MKKTLVILPILAASVAFADMTAQETLDQIASELVVADYHPGAAFTLSLKMNSIGSTAWMVKLTDNRYLVNQGGNYIGISTTSGNTISNVGIDSIAFDDATKVHTYTSTEGNIMSMWNQTNQATISNIPSGTRGIGAWLGVEIATDCQDSTVTLTYHSDGAKDIYLLKGVVLNANEIGLRDGLNITSYNLEAAPEPATATLSLLALACLVTRRRR